MPSLQTSALFAVPCRHASNIARGPYERVHLRRNAGTSLVLAGELRGSEVALRAYTLQQTIEIRQSKVVGIVERHPPGILLCHDGRVGGGVFAVDAVQLEAGSLARLVFPSVVGPVLPLDCTLCATLPFKGLVET